MNFTNSPNQLTNNQIAHFLAEVFIDDRPMSLPVQKDKAGSQLPNGVIEVGNWAAAAGLAARLVKKTNGYHHRPVKWVIRIKKV